MPRRAVVGPVPRGSVCKVGRGARSAGHCGAGRARRSRWSLRLRQERVLRVLLLLLLAGGDSLHTYIISDYRSRAVTHCQLPRADIVKYSTQSSNQFQQFETTASKSTYSCAMMHGAHHALVLEQQALLVRIEMSVIVGPRALRCEPVHARRALRLRLLHLPRLNLHCLVEQHLVLLLLLQLLLA